MRYIPFRIWDIRSWTTEQKIWLSGWRKRAKAAKRLAIADFNAGRNPKLNSALWAELKKWLLVNVFDGKCAYCEIKIAGGFFGEGEHYRPKGKITVREDGKRISVDQKPGVPHPGYFWLAYDFTNLLPACDLCNNTKTDQCPVEKKHLFDISKTSCELDEHEKPLLLHPYRDNRNRCERTPCETYARAGMMAAVRYGGGSDERRGVEWRWRGERALLD
jgi:hypothetical protein